MRVLVHGSTVMLPRFVLPLPTSKVQQRELREILDHTANAVLFVTVEENQRDSILSKHKNPILSQETCGIRMKHFQPVGWVSEFGKMVVLAFGLGSEGIN